MSNGACGDRHSVSEPARLVWVVPTTLGRGIGRPTTAARVEALNIPRETD